MFVVFFTVFVVLPSGALLFWCRSLLILFKIIVNFKVMKTDFKIIPVTHIQYGCQPFPEACPSGWHTVGLLSS